MASFMLDTNICIYIRRKRSLEVLRRMEVLRPGDVCMSMVTYAELRYGAEKNSQPERALSVLDELVKHISVAPLVTEVAIHYGGIRADLERRGLMIGSNDLWIAAHARSLGMTLVTSNAREFQRVVGLTVENWTQA